MGVARGERSMVRTPLAPLSASTIASPCRQFIVPSSAIERAPNAEASRSEGRYRTMRGLFLSLQAKIHQGDTKAIEAAVRILVHLAKINGFLAPSKLEVTGVGVIPITVIQRAVKAVERDE